MFAAKRRSGKTVLLNYLIEECIIENIFDWGYIVSATTGITGELNIIPDDYIRSEWNPEDIKKIIKYQEEQIKNGTPRNCFIILDDIIGTVDLDDPLLKEIVTKGRHWNIWLFLCIQKLTSIVPTLYRENTDILFFFNSSNQKVLDTVHEEFISMKQSKREWYNWVANNLGDHKALMIDVNAENDDAEKMAIVKAPAPPPKDVENPGGFMFDFTQTQQPGQEEIDPLEGKDLTQNEETDDPDQQVEKRMKENKQNTEQYIKKHKKKQVTYEEDEEDYEEPPPKKAKKAIFKEPKKKINKKK